MESQNQTLQASQNVAPQGPSMQTFTSPPQQSHKNPWVVVIIIVVSIIIIGLGAGYYFLFVNRSVPPPRLDPSEIPVGIPSKDQGVTSEATSGASLIDTSNWKVFKERVSRYEIRVPSDWKEIDSEGGVHASSPDGKLNVRFTGNQMKPGFSLKDCLHDYLENYTSYKIQSLQYLEEKEVIANGIKGWSSHIRTIVSEEDGEIWAVFEDKTVVEEPMCLGVTLWPYSVSKKVIVDQIISTFRFDTLTTSKSL